MSLNIKNEETHKLAKELAGITGESMSEAVHVALLERLGRLRKQRGVGRVDILVAIGEECAKHLKEPYKSTEHGKLLYDDQLGLPK